MKKIFLLFLFTSYCLFSNAQNPIAKGYADPAMQVFNGKMYMAIGKDLGPNVTKFQMPSWRIISSTDLRNWKVESDINPKDTFLGEGYMGCWAADITSHNGKYYFYFSLYGEATGVLEANNPGGPYIDVLKKPLLPKEMSINYEYDPTAFTDKDGKKYIIYGRDGKLNGNLLHYQIASLSNDMVSLAAAPKDLLTDQKYGFGGENRAKDHSYFHYYNGNYYLSCGNDYMSSKNLTGPFTNPRKTGTEHGHSSYSEFNGQTYHAWEYTCVPYNNRMYRQVMLTYLHYKDNGDMVDDLDFLQAGKYYENGVGSYSAKWDKIEAEWFFKKSANALKKESPNGGFEIQNLSNNDFLNYPAVKDLSANATINFNLSSKIGGGKIEIREGSTKGNLLGTCVIPKTDSFSTYKTASCKLKNKAGETDLYFVFKGGKDDLVHLDSYKFSK